MQKARKAKEASDDIKILIPSRFRKVLVLMKCVDEILNLMLKNSCIVWEYDKKIKCYYRIKVVNKYKKRGHAPTSLLSFNEAMKSYSKALNLFDNILITQKNIWYSSSFILLSGKLYKLFFFIKM